MRDDRSHQRAPLAVGESDTGGGLAAARKGASTALDVSGRVRGTAGTWARQAEGFGMGQRVASGGDRAEVAPRGGGGGGDR